MKQNILLLFFFFFIKFDINATSLCRFKFSMGKRFTAIVVIELKIITKFKKKYSFKIDVNKFTIHSFRHSLLLVV
jgi:hypothetical protein